MSSWVKKNYDLEQSSTDTQPQSVTDRALLALYRHENAHRNKNDQRKWSKQVQERYDVVQPVQERDEVSRKKGWCPVVRGWVHYGKLKAANREDLVGKTAHLVPHKLGSNTAGLIFATEGEDVIWSVSNALWLHPKVEKAFDDGKIIIVPTSPIETSNEFKLRVIDQSLLEKSNRKFGDKSQYDRTELDGRALQFRNDERPSKRFLYFHYLMVMEDTMRTCEEEDAKSKMGALFEPVSVWATPGSYLEKGVLNTLSKRIVERRIPPDLLVTEEMVHERGSESRPEPPHILTSETTEGQNFRGNGFMAENGELSLEEYLKWPTIRLPWDNHVVYLLPEKSDARPYLPSYYTTGW